MKMMGPMMILPPIYYDGNTEERLLAHVSTDKPFYKPNEVVFIEVHIVDALTKTPYISDSVDVSISPMAKDYVYKPIISADAQILDSFDQEVFMCASRNLFNGTIVFDEFKVPKD